MSDTGYLQINDIDLTKHVVPTNIHIERQSLNHHWQTLRSRNTAKVKSGYSTVQIRIDAAFVDPDGWSKLRRLVAQLRVTPFCYVENQLIRDSILEGDVRSSMVLALSNMHIRKGELETNVIHATFNFLWFNYKPFTDIWQYRVEMFSNLATSKPEQSHAWFFMSEAELKRGQYAHPPEALNDNTVFRFNQFWAPSILPKDANDQDINKAVKAYFNIQDQMRSAAQQQLSGASEFPQTIQPSAHLREQASSLLGHTTSMELDLFSDITGEYQGKQYTYQGLSWEPVSDGKSYVTYGGKVLFRRDAALSTKQNNMHVIGVDISFSHNLAMLPIVGESYATYQHVGSADAVVNLQIMTTSDTPLQKLASFYNVIESAEIQFRNVPAEHRRIKIVNDIVNMLGIYDGMIEGMVIDTVPGSVGTYSINMTISDDPFLPTQGKFVSNFAFSSAALRKKLMASLLGNIRYYERPDLSKARKYKDSKVKRYMAEAWRSLTELAKGRQWGYRCTLSESQHDYARLRACCDDLANALDDLYNDIANVFRSNFYTNKLSDNPAGVFTKFLLSWDEDTFPGITTVVRDVVENVVVPLMSKQTDDPLQGGQIGGGGFSVPTNAQSLPDEYMQSLDSDFQQLNSLSKIKQNFQSITNPTSDQKAAHEKITAQYDELLIQIRQRALLQVKSEVHTYQTKNDTLQKQHAESVQRLSNDDVGTVDALALWAQDRVAGGERFINESKITNRGAPSFWYDMLNKHRATIIRTLDRWISQNILRDKALSHISAELMETLNKVEGTTCYPDFPTKEMVEIIRNHDSVGMQEFIDLLFELWNKRGDATKGLSPALMINPDFYLISKGVDSPSNGLESHAIKEIKETVSRSLKSYTTEHKNWLRRVEGQHATRKQRIERQKQDSKEFFEETVGKFEDQLYGSNAHSIKSAMREQVEYQAPDDFPDGTVITDAAYSLSREGVSVSFSKLGDLSDDQLDALWVSSSRPQSTLTLSEELSDDNRIVHEIDSSAYTDTSHAPKMAKTSSSLNGTTGTWIWPIDRCLFSDLSSKFGTRINPVWKRDNRAKYSTVQELEAASYSLGKRQMHYGIDIPVERNTPIVAAATGRVIFARKGEYRYNQKGVLQDESAPTGTVVIDHENGWFTVYKHVAPDDINQKWVNTYAERPRVQQGELIAHVDTTGYSTGPHLHFETLYGGRSPKDHAKDPLLVLSGAWVARYPLPPGAANADDLVSKMIGEFEAEMLVGQGSGMARAYPTFKLYFIERDANERREYGFDDFFSYAAVKEIQVIRHKDIPADLVLMTLTNISGALSNRRFKSKLDPDTYRIDFTRGVIGKEDADQPGNTNTPDENPLISMLLQPGNEIQLRLGYNNNPNLLDTVFNGQITEVQFSETDDLVQIIAQSYGTELVQRIYGLQKAEYLNTGDTKQIVEHLLGKTEVKHFGRWEPGHVGLGKYFDMLTERWQFKSNPVDVNNFAPGGDRVFNPYKMDNQPYWLLRTTIWDVLKEMTLRHPGYIVMPLPYEGQWGPRMTLYFGLPNQLYYARDPSFKENQFASVLGEIADEIKQHPNTDNVAQLTKDLTNADILLNAKVLTEQLKKVQSLDIGREKWFRLMKQTLARRTGIARPVRGYHLATSSCHILANNISHSAKKTFNAINLTYSDSISASEHQAGARSSWLGSVADTVLPGFAQKLLDGSTSSLSMKADTEVPDEDTREMFATFTTCVGEDQARRYALSLVWQAMKKAYSGTLILVGNPSIKPHDVIYVCDTYNQMYGQIEVAQVVHKFSAQTGFITEVQPEMVIHINQTATMATDEIMGMVAAEALGAARLDTAADLLTQGVEYYKMAQKAVESLDSYNPLTVLPRWLQNQAGRSRLGSLLDNMPINPMTAAALPTKLVSSTALWLGRKYLAHSQYNNPFRFEPLVYRDYPLMQGIHNKVADGGFFYQAGKFISEGEKGLPVALNKLWDNYNPSRWLFGADSRGNLIKAIGNIDQGYTGPKE